MDSVRSQTYRNLFTIVHSDNMEDTYLEGDIIIRGEKYPSEAGTFPANLYCNRLMDAIPDSNSWYFFLDDDDKIHSPDSIERAIDLSLQDHINVTKAIWKDTADPRIIRIFPDDYHGKITTFSTGCFILHSKYKDKARWWADCCGDLNYTSKLNLPINWIDVIMQEQQISKGYGKKEKEYMGEPN